MSSRPSLRFVLSRRWALFALAVVAAAYASWWLGNWQFHRLTERKVDNTIVRTNEDRAVAPVADVLSPRRAASQTDEWRLVTATGSYDPDKTVVVRYRTRDEGTGVDIVVPLMTADGTALLVDRGWLETNPQGTDRAAIPDPPAGQVTVTGWVRLDGTGDSTSVDALSTRAINSEAIGAATSLPVYRGFVELDTEDPGATTPLLKVDLPELDNGPHFFYGLQWYFFGILAVFGFFYLMYDEWLHGPRGERLTRPQRPDRPGRPKVPERPVRAAKPPSKAQRRRELVAAELTRRSGKTPTEDRQDRQDAEHPSV